MVDRLADSSHPLLEPFTDAQQTLFSILAGDWLSGRGDTRHPTRYSVERRLERADPDLDLDTVLRSYPFVTDRDPIPLSWRYRAVWFDSLGRSPESLIGLTVAGMAHLPPQNQPVIEYFVRVLREMARYRQLTPVDPSITEDPIITETMLMQEIGHDGGGWLHLMPLLFVHEPATAGGNRGVAADPQAPWSWGCGRPLRYFGGVASVDDYLHRVTRYLQGPPSGGTSTVDADSPEPPLTAKKDFFICHASEDKQGAARPISNELTRRGYTVWLDESELRVGDSLRKKIDDGLANCRFGVVILSNSFFGKPWTDYELDGLVNKQMQHGRKVILPVWQGVSRDQVAAHSPSLAGVLAANMSQGARRVVDDLVHAYKGEQF